MSSWLQTFTLFWMLYSFIWVIPRCLNFICQHFGTLYSSCVGSMKRGQSVPKSWHVKFIGRGMAPKKRIKHLKWSFVKTHNALLDLLTIVIYYLKSTLRVGFLINKLQTLKGVYLWCYGFFWWFSIHLNQIQSTWRLKQHVSPKRQNNPITLHFIRL